MHTIYANVRVPTARSDEPVSQWWLRQRDRRTYKGGVVFRPGSKVHQDTFNLWNGFDVEPDPTASCRLFLDHLRNVICCGAEDHYAYIMGYLAHMIQRPQEKPGVALILKGLKGVGKDTLAEYVKKLFFRHTAKVSNMEHLTGKFNAHQERILLLHVEEGIWAGNRNAHGQLQSLITSPTVMIERKGIDPIEMTSVLRLFISSTRNGWCRLRPTSAALRSSRSRMSAGAIGPTSTQSTAN